MNKLYLIICLITGCATTPPADPSVTCDQIYQLYQAQQIILNICNKTTKCTMTYDNVRDITMTQTALFECYQEHKLEQPANDVR